MWHIWGPMSHWHPTITHCSTCWFRLELNHDGCTESRERSATNSTTTDRIKAILPHFGWMRWVWCKSPQENLSETKCLCERLKKEIWKETFLLWCLCEIFAPLYSTKWVGGRKYYWMVKQHVCACVYICWIRRNLKGRKDKERQTETEWKACPQCLKLKRLNFISWQTLWQIFAYPM